MSTPRDGEKRPLDETASVATHRDGVRAGNRRQIAKSITLLESRRADHAARGQAVLEELIPHTGRALRLGITGTPGVGKSTFIEALGLHLIGAGHRVAVLAVDPSQSPHAAVRSSATRRAWSGSRRTSRRSFARRLRAARSAASRIAPARRCCVLEAAGFDVVIVETVGVGQSEVAVASMVDCFAVLLQPGAGDELQGMKKGVLELADLLVVNKADGEQLEAARRAQIAYQHALSLLRPASPKWRPPVLLASSTRGEGIAAFWDTVLEHRDALVADGAFAARRSDQARAWLWTLLDEGLQRGFRQHPAVARALPRLEAEVAARKTSPGAAARELLELYGKS